MTGPILSPRRPPANNRLWPSGETMARGAATARPGGGPSGWGQEKRSYRMTPNRRDKRATSCRSNHVGEGLNDEGRDNVRLEDELSDDDHPTERRKPTRQAVEVGCYTLSLVAPRTAPPVGSGNGFIGSDLKSDPPVKYSYTVVSRTAGAVAAEGLSLVQRRGRRQRPAVTTSLGARTRRSRSRLWDSSARAAAPPEEWWSSWSRQAARQLRTRCTASRRPRS